MSSPFLPLTAARQAHIGLWVVVIVLLIDPTLCINCAGTLWHRCCRDRSPINTTYMGQQHTHKPALSAMAIPSWHFYLRLTIFNVVSLGTYCGSGWTFWSIFMISICGNLFMSQRQLYCNCVHGINEVYSRWRFSYLNDYWHKIKAYRKTQYGLLQPPYLEPIVYK